MKLSELINRAQKAKEDHGDLNVVVAVSYDEQCRECRESKHHLKTGKTYRAGTYNEGTDDCYFCIDGSSY